LKGKEGDVMKKLFTLLFGLIVCCSWSFAQPSVGPMVQDSQSQAGQAVQLDQTQIDRRHKRRRHGKKGKRRIAQVVSSTRSA
jgi:hypothetical protein